MNAGGDAIDERLAHPGAAGVEEAGTATTSWCGSCRGSTALAELLQPGWSASAPLAWQRDVAEARNRLREWVSTSGTGLDRDRPTRQTAWPGEDPIEPAPESVIEHRDEDFVQFVLADVAARRSAQAQFDVELPFSEAGQASGE